MPAKSSSQKNFMAMVYAYKNGTLDTKNLSDDIMSKIKKAASGMSKTSVRHYTETPSKGLPKHVSESFLQYLIRTQK